MHRMPSTSPERNPIAQLNHVRHLAFCSVQCADDLQQTERFLSLCLVNNIEDPNSVEGTKGRNYVRNWMSLGVQAKPKGKELAHFVIEMITE